jgi:hypothetical protein
MLEAMNHTASCPRPAVPVLLLAGPTGAGKTTVALEVARLLRGAGIPNAMADLAVIAQCWPHPPMTGGTSACCAATWPA